MKNMHNAEVIDIINKYNTILSLSDLIQIQTDAAFFCADQNQNGRFPDSNIKWKYPDDVDPNYDMTDKLLTTDQHAEISKIIKEHIKECDDQFRIATHRFQLNSVKIDKSMVHLGLVLPEDSTEVDIYASEWNGHGDAPTFVLIGEIAGHDGHVIVCRDDGKMFHCVHTFNFYVLPPGEQ